MAKSKSSKQWLKEHFDDEYVVRSRQDGYRSRAVYKLQEIHKKDRLFKSGMNIIDLGSAPGGWSQYAAQLLGKTGRIVASDILPMPPLPNVEFIQGDFREDDVYEKIMACINGEKFDVVISDMAPNLSGVDASDQAKSIYLCELALEMSKDVLKPQGSLLVKMFQGSGSDDYLKMVKTYFKKVKIRKPLASRSRSREVYVLAQDFIV